MIGRIGAESAKVDMAERYASDDGRVCSLHVHASVRRADAAADESPQQSPQRKTAAPKDRRSPSG